MRQNIFDLPISQHTVLVDVKTIRIARHVDDETVYAEVDHGKYFWVWNVGLGSEIRELRFWVKEIILGSGAVERLTIDEVIEKLLPANRLWLRRQEVKDLLVVSNPTVVKLAAEIGAITVDGKLRYPRAGL